MDEKTTRLFVFIVSLIIICSLVASIFVKCDNTYNNEVEIDSCNDEVEIDIDFKITTTPKIKSTSKKNTSIKTSKVNTYNKKPKKNR